MARWTKGSTSATLIVISFYDRRQTDQLYDLLGSLGRHSAGGEFDVLVVVNQARHVPIALPPTPFKATVIYRENTGMNIGAWDAGWRRSKDYMYFVFLQDECLVQQDGWLRALIRRVDAPGVGMVGESLNLKWDKSWPELERINKGAIMPDHLVDGRPAERVAVYLHCMRQWGIDPGMSGRHLRSLVWAFRRDVLERIDGFPVGANYGECIAAEISVGRAVEALGLSVAQCSEKEFTFIWHREWNQDHPGEPYSHSRSIGQWVSYDLGELRQKLDDEAQSLLERASHMDGSDKALLLASLLLKLQDRDYEISILRDHLKKHTGSRLPKSRDASRRTWKASHAGDLA